VGWRAAAVNARGLADLAVWPYFGYRVSAISGGPPPQEEWY
jgi:hypothetical protein